ncbi:MAG: FAD-binding oxidoreductase [Chitinophagaceae bacterium]|nr:FAD-binding oxidoreductase [Chitinophagaceae bacterium]
MQTEYLVIGGGIAGTLISYELLLHNKSVMVIDDTTAVKASIVAGAILNPVNIKQWNVAKDYQQYIAAALDSYTSLQKLLNTPVISEVPIIAFDAPAKKEDILIQPFLHNITGRDAAMIKNTFATPYTAQKISPAFQIHTANLFSAWRKYLLAKNAFLDAHFEMEQLSIANGTVMYKHIHAEKIIFCEGAAAIQNPLFSHLPFTKNRGDALLIFIPGLPKKFIYHNGIRLIPTGNQLFWCGSNYTWNYTNLEPDTEWRKQTENTLKDLLNIPFIIKDHIVAERPTTAGQQPLMLLHDSLPAAMFNGLGTKGFLMGPLLAKSFAKKLVSK